MTLPRRSIHFKPPPFRVPSPRAPAIHANQNGKTVPHSLIVALSGMNHLKERWLPNTQCVALCELDSE